MGYPTVGRKRASPSLASQEERLGALVGDRGPNAQDRKAVTRDVLAGMGNITLKAVRVTAAPTAAEYNNLLEDVRTVAAVLNAMGAKFTGL